MNNGRIWCVVSPTVGLPLFLGSVALMAFTVHFAVLNNTTWFKDYWNGGARAKVGANVDDAVKKQSLAKVEGGASEFVINTQPVAQKGGDASASFVVTVTPKTSSSGGGLTRTAENDTR
jgi:light-harvesting protein B-800-850 alpha chain